MAIYTKKGDGGETGLYSLDKSRVIRVSKSSLRIEAIGSIDEANTSLGIAASFTKNKSLKGKITVIQRHLFEVGAILAGAKLIIDADLSKKMEREIDKMDKELPVLSHFVLPGGGKVGSLLFMARTFVRRAERSVVALSKKIKIDRGVLIYLNRLSDYVYTLARHSNFREHQKEEIWKP